MPDHTFVPAPPIAIASEPADPASRPSPARPDPNRPGDLEGRIVVTSWVDPTVDRRGHDPRSRYVERFWLGVLGPSATWLLRRLTDELSAPGRDGVTTVDLAGLARTMGMSYTPDRPSPFSRAIQRCVMFGVAHHTTEGLAIRRRLPNVTERQLRRFPPQVAIDHDRWLERHRPVAVSERARTIGQAMLDAGDCPGQLEAQLAAIGIDPAVAGAVAADLRTAA